MQSTLFRLIDSLIISIKDRAALKADFKGEDYVESASKWPRERKEGRLANKRVFSRKRQVAQIDDSMELVRSRRSKKSKTDGVKSEANIMPVKAVKRSASKSKMQNKSGTTSLQSVRARRTSGAERPQMKTKASKLQTQDKSACRIGQLMSPAGNYSLGSIQHTSRSEAIKRAAAGKRQAASREESLRLGGQQNLKKSAAFFAACLAGSHRNSRGQRAPVLTEKLEASGDRFGHQMDRSRESKMVKLTVSTCKNRAPIVQINNIVGDINQANSQVDASTSRISRPKAGLFKTTRVEMHRTTDCRSQSRKSPSIEIALESDRTRLSGLLKKNQAYDRKAIADYLKKNRLLGV